MARKMKPAEAAYYAACTVLPLRLRSWALLSRKERDGWRRIVAAAVKAKATEAPKRARGREG